MQLCFKHKSYKGFWEFIVDNHRPNTVGQNATQRNATQRDLEMKGMLDVGVIGGTALLLIVENEMLVCRFLFLFHVGFLERMIVEYLFSSSVSGGNQTLTFFRFS